MYALYNKDDDQMFVMTVEQVFKYLGDKSALFQNYGVYSDGATVKVYETSAGPNGCLGESSISEFLEGFEDEGFFIRPVTPYV